MIKTDLAIAIPPGTYARVAPRSGLAWKHSIDTGAGVVDEDYRGPVNVILFNYSDTDFEGERRPDLHSFCLSILPHMPRKDGVRYRIMTAGC
jgi:deoxyuridine 5'-triphosphate nucleotidohydrolase